MYLSYKYIYHRKVSLRFSAGRQLVFTVLKAKNFELNFFIRETFLLHVNGQTRLAKSSSQPVNLPSALPFYPCLSLARM